MSEMHEGFTPPQESEKKSNLNRVYQILRTDAMENRHMMCQRLGNTLSFYALSDSEQAAQSIHDELIKLGLQPRLEGKKVFLTAQFPGNEIDKLADTFNSIPKRKE
jgi:hypothetical protein